MTERAFDRAFNKALSRQKVAADKVEAQRPLTDAEREAQEAQRLREDATPMTAADAIKRMLLADKDKDYFRYGTTALPSNSELGGNNTGSVCHQQHLCLVDHARSRLGFGSEALCCFALPCSGDYSSFKLMICLQFLPWSGYVKVM